MAYNWSKFPKHDKLSHTQAIIQQKNNIIRSFKNSKSKADALKLETFLNQMYYNGKNTQSGLKNFSTQEQNKMKKIEKVLNEMLKRQFNGTTATSNMYNLGITTTKSINVYSYAATLKNRITSFENYVATKVQSMGVTSKEAIAFENQYKNIKKEIEALNDKDLVRANSSLGMQYNDLIQELFVENYKQMIGQNLENVVAIADISADTFADSTVGQIVDLAMRKKVGGKSSGTAPRMSTQGMRQSEINSFLKNNKSWYFQGGYLIYNQTTADKANIRFGIEDTSSYYVPIKNYYKGASGDIHFSSSTHLASFLSSSMVTEKYSRAYLRYAGWKWKEKYPQVTSSPYEAEQLYDLAKKLILILGISGKGFQNTDAEILVFNNRNNLTFQCYSIQDIADSVLLRDIDTNRINISGLPKLGELRENGSSLQAAFLNTHVAVQVNNLKAMLKY